MHTMLSSLKITSFFLITSLFPLMTTQCDQNLLENTKIVYFKQNETILGTLKVKLAKSQEEKYQGLRNISNLPKDHGMLFIYENPEQLTFVMGHVLIPLDIIFVDKDKRLLRIYEAKACLGEDLDCGYYYSVEKAQYVVETNLGWSKEHGLKIGDSIEIFP